MPRRQYRRRYVCFFSLHYSCSTAPNTDHRGQRKTTYFRYDAKRIRNRNENMQCDVYANYCSFAIFGFKFKTDKNVVFSSAFCDIAVRATFQSGVWAADPPLRRVRRLLSPRRVRVLFSVGHAINFTYQQRGRDVVAGSSVRRALRTDVVRATR